MFNKVFISYAKEDSKFAEKLYDLLESIGTYIPWIDKKKLLPGQNWEIEIESAVENADFFIPLLSKISVAKRGYVQKEFKLALKCYEKKLDSDIYIIPYKIDDCEVPKGLSKFQWAELNNPNSFEQILSALNLQRKTLLEDYNKFTNGNADNIDEPIKPNVDFETVDFEVINSLIEQTTNGMRETYNAATIIFDANRRVYAFELEKRFIITSNFPSIRYAAQFYANKFPEDSPRARQFYKENLIKWNDLNVRAKIQYKQPNATNYSQEEELVISNMVFDGNYIPFDIYFKTNNDFRIPLLKDTEIILRYSYEVPIRVWGSYINRTIGLYKTDAVVRFICDDKLPDLKYAVFRLNSEGIPTKIDAYKEDRTINNSKKIIELKIPAEKSFSRYRVNWDAQGYFGGDEINTENGADRLGVTNR
jgi:hypothetical protein